MTNQNDFDKGTLKLKTGLAEMLKGGVIMDVTDDAQARIAEDAGAVAVMALERVPSDIRRDGGVARMSDPAMIEKIMATVSIPVMAKCRIGHFAEAQVLQALGVDYIDESEVLTPADEANHVDKHAFKVPFVCGCRDLGEALRRIGEGAALMRTKGEAGSGNIVEAVRHMRTVMTAIRRLTVLQQRRADGRGQEPGRAVRAGPAGGSRGQASGAELRRRRHRDPRRRGADDAARRRVGLRRLGHLQVRGSGRSARGPSCGRRPTTRTPRSWPRSPAGLARRCPASRPPSWMSPS